MTLPAENVAPQLTRNRRLIIVIGVVLATRPQWLRRLDDPPDLS